MNVDLPPVLHRAVASRAGSVLRALAGESVDLELSALLDALAQRLAGHEPDRYWLAVAAIGGRLPVETEVEALTRRSRLSGPSAALRSVVDHLARRYDAGADLPEVSIVSDRVTVDVQHTAAAGFTSGIQRVVRECVRCWSRRGDVQLLSWTPRFESLRSLDDAEWANVTLGEPRPLRTTPGVVVPWRTTHLVPELPGDPGRVLRIAAMARYGVVDVGLVGYDAIPLTTPSCVADGMVGHFARWLAAAAHTRRIAAISHAAAREYDGWRAMLAGRGLAGPDIRAITLPVRAPGSTPGQLVEARGLLSPGGEPLVLVVGSHEPRKNHLAVLHAAELLWRDGVTFSLAFVGSGAWKSDAFDERVAQLQRAGRPVQSVRSLPDGFLGAAYRVAHCTVFPSLNEGYGLPVAESLASGTPVVTSDFGSTAEIVAPQGKPRGGLLVDPHDDHAITEALRRLLVDTDLYARLAGEAEATEQGSWEDYAASLWSYLVPPSGRPAT